MSMTKYEEKYLYSWIEGTTEGNDREFELLLTKKL